MKRHFTPILLAGISMLVTAATVKNVQAETAISDEQSIRIRSSCVELKSSLTQLHASDALLRVNRGQLYELFSTKLMAPLNSRISLNKLDGVTLVSTAVQYERNLDTFRSNYRHYESSMSRTLEVNCSTQPEVFYEAIVDTREKRNRVHDSVVALQSTIEQYRSEFESFAVKVSQ